MYKARVLIFLFLYFCEPLNCEDNPYLKALQAKPWKSIQKYVEVRRGVFLFYWFYYADGTDMGANEKPVIIWIQGGPGLAASGVANFAEIGPLTMDFKPRNHTWVNGRNLLLIDHPVNTGFSYSTNTSSYVTTDKDAVKDLIRLIKVFFKRHQEFRRAPTYLIGQSYGGKLCPRLAVHLHAAIKRKRIHMNFKGIGIGSGWVCPKEISLTQPETMYYMGIIDVTTYNRNKRMMQKVSHLTEQRRYSEAIKVMNSIYQMTYFNFNKNINYNNLNQDSSDARLAILADDFNKYVKPTVVQVNQSLQWNYMSELAFDSLEKSFLLPSNKFVELLLNRTNLKIAIYNGNLDLIVPVAGVSNWVHALKWNGSHEFNKVKSIQIRGHRNGFYKAVRSLSFWTVHRAGHWVPEDNPEAMEQILDHLTDRNIS